MRPCNSLCIYCMVIFICFFSIFQTDRSSSAPNRRVEGLRRQQEQLKSEIRSALDLLPVDTSYSNCVSAGVAIGHNSQPPVHVTTHCTRFTPPSHNYTGIYYTYTTLLHFASLPSLAHDAFSRDRSIKNFGITLCK